MSGIAPVTGGRPPPSSAIKPDNAWAKNAKFDASAAGGPDARHCSTMATKSSEGSSGAERKARGRERARACARTRKKKSEKVGEWPLAMNSSCSGSSYIKRDIVFTVSAVRIGDSLLHVELLLFRRWALHVLHFGLEGFLLGKGFGQAPFVGAPRRHGVQQKDHIGRVAVVFVRHLKVRRRMQATHAIKATIMDHARTEAQKGSTNHKSHEVTHVDMQTRICTYTQDPHVNTCYNSALMNTNTCVCARARVCVCSLTHRGQIVGSCVFSELRPGVRKPQVVELGVGLGLDHFVVPQLQPDAPKVTAGPQHHQGHAPLPALCRHHPQRGWVQLRRHYQREAVEESGARAKPKKAKQSSSFMKKRPMERRKEYIGCRVK